MRKNHQHLRYHVLDRWLARGAVLLIVALQIGFVNDLSIGPSTTLADLFTLLRVADLSSAVRAPSMSWLNDELDDSVAYGRQARLRWWAVDSFFSAPLVRGDDAAGMRKRSWSLAHGDEVPARIVPRSDRDRVLLSTADALARRSIAL